MTPRARAGFEKALEGHPFVTLADLEADIARGVAYVWSGENADVFCRIEGVVCEMGPSCGDIEEMTHRALPQIEQWARSNQCTEMHIQSGRHGWVKKLAPYGYSLAAVVLRKAL